ncbi:hypothetical protein BH10PSE5_BH10PSE5_27420 [soil metagenome]
MVVFALALAWWVPRAFARTFTLPPCPACASLRRAAPFLFAAAVLCGDLAADYFGSFGFADRADETLSRAVGLVSGPFYGVFGRPGQDAIVIVALDSDFVERSGGAWPPPYKATQEVVEQILAAQPKAVFLDSYYAQPRRTPVGWPDMEGAGALAKVSAGARAAGVPILTGPVAKDQPALAPIAAAVDQVGLRSPDERPFAYSLYDGEQRPMAAVELYRIWKGGAAGAPAPLPPGNLSLDWGFGASAWMGERLAEGDKACVAPTLPARIKGALALIWRSLTPNLTPESATARGLLVDCPYFDIVPAAWLADPVVRARLRDRVVLVGSTVPWLRDQAPTPLLGEVPGVMAHAMALDNLIQNGVWATRYPKAHKHIGNLDNGDFVQAGLLAGGFLMIWRLRRYTGLVRGESLPFELKLRVWAIIAAVGVSLSFIFCWPLFKLLIAAAAGGIAVEAWETLQDHKHRQEEAEA